MEALQPHEPDTGRVNRRVDGRVDPHLLGRVDRRLGRRRAWFHRPLLALVLASALWGASVSGTKYALGGFGPFTLLAIELLAAAAALWATLIVRGYRSPRSWKLAALLGLLEPGLAYLGDNFGLAHTSAANAAVITGLESALVVVLAAVVLGEAVTRPAVLAVVAALGGLVVLAGGSSGHRATLGDLCVAGGALSASLYTVVAKRCDDGSDALALTAWQFMSAAALSISGAIIRWIGGTETTPLHVAPRFWLAAVVVGVGGLGGSFLIFNTVISKVDAGWAAIVLNLIPVFGLLSAFALLGESPTATGSIGAALIAASVTYFSICDHRDAPRGEPLATDGSA